MEDYFDKDFQKKLKVFFDISNNPDTRRTGRTTLLCKILIEQAIETDEPVKIIDHWVTAKSNHRVLNSTRSTLERVFFTDYLNKNLDVTIIFNKQDYSFIIKKGPLFSTLLYHSIRIKSYIPIKESVIQNKKLLLIKK